MCFHDRRYDSRATCSALPPVSWLSIVLGEFYFWLGFGLCLTILLAPWGCRRAYCGPHCGSESTRVLASLLGPSPSGVRHLRCAWWSLRPGWLLNFSLTGAYVWTFLLWTLAVLRDWVDLPSPSSHFQDSVSCLTCSHDSQLLRLPAIDIVWRWPCLPRYRLLQTPCYCGVLGGL